MEVVKCFKCLLKFLRCKLLEAGRTFGQSCCSVPALHMQPVSVGLSAGQGLHRLLNCPLQCTGPILSCSAVSQFSSDRIFQDYLSSLWCFCCRITSVFLSFCAESHQWGVCCCSACKPAAWHHCGEWRLQWQAEICHSWETCSKSNLS